MRHIFKLSAIACTVLSLSACNSSSESEEDAGFSLQRDLEYVEGFQLLVSEGDLWLTDMSGRVSRLAANDDEWEFAVNGITGNATFLFNPAPEQFVMTTQQIRMFSVSNDGGEEWQLHEGQTQHPLPYTSYSAMLQIDNDVYMHAGEGLHRTQLDVNRPEDSFRDIEVLHESDVSAVFPFENRVRALIHNEARNELWWAEFGGTGSEDYRVMRMDLVTEDVELVFTHDVNLIKDGFVDDTDPNTLVIGGEDGLRVSYDNGETWERHVLDEGSDHVVYSVQQDLVSLNYYAYVSVEQDDTRTDEMWCSVDQGASWTRTTLAEGSDGIFSSRGPMVFHDRDGARYFFIPTYDGVVQGALGDVTC